MMALDNDGKCDLKRESKKMAQKAATNDDRLGQKWRSFEHISLEDLMYPLRY
jgi:hypothetical protein